MSGSGGKGKGGAGPTVSPDPRRAQPRLRPASVLLFEADVPQVSVIDTDDTVVLLEQALLLGLASALQTLDQQAKSPEMVKRSCQKNVEESPWVQHGCSDMSGHDSIKV